MIILTRQARDKHKKNLSSRWRFCFHADFDRLFGTWRDYGEFEAETMAREKAKLK